jgi:hypothetical protein
MLDFGAAVRCVLDVLTAKAGLTNWEKEPCPAVGPQGIPPEVRHGQRGDFRKKTRVSGMD